MYWCQTGYRPLSEPNMAYFTDVYLRRAASCYFVLHVYDTNIRRALLLVRYWVQGNICILHERDCNIPQACEFVSNPYFTFELSLTFMVCQTSLVKKMYCYLWDMHDISDGYLCMWTCSSAVVIFNSTFQLYIYDKPAYKAEHARCAGG